MLWVREVLGVKSSPHKCHTLYLEAVVNAKSCVLCAAVYVSLLVVAVAVIRDKGGEIAVGTVAGEE